MPPKIELIFDSHEDENLYRVGILNKTDNVEIWVVDGIPDPVQAEELAKAACVGFRYGWDTFIEHHKNHIASLKMR